MENNQPKILIFSLAYHPFVGGAEVAIKEITDRLGDGFDFEMITANLDGRQKEFERLGNINVYRISLFHHLYEGVSFCPPSLRRRGLGEVKKAINKYLFPWLAYRKAIQLQKKNNYSIIWAMMANQAGWAALKFKKKFPQVKYLLTLQEGDSEWDIFWRTALIRPIYKNIYRRADYIQAISNFLKKRAVNLGVRCPIEVVPNGVKFSFSPTAGGGVNPPNGGEEGVGVKKIITTSRLVKKNGIEYLIRAMVGVNGNLLIIGDGKLRNYLKNLTDKLNLNNKVKFVGEVSYDEVHGYLRKSNVFVRPSLSEGLGNSFLEAMGDALPVIATPVGGIPDFLHDGETGLPAQTGWFCKVKDPKSIAEKINWILDDKNKEEVNRVVEKARRMVIEKYNWNKISQDIKNIFNKLTS